MEELNQLIAARLMLWIPLLLSLSVHEWAHARAAWQLGDDTAAMMGRLTLNPGAHIDPVGTVLLPLLGVPFGWAKPVPVNPMRFRSHVGMRKGMMLTALAGPVSNLVIAAAAIVALAMVVHFPPANEKLLRGLWDFLGMLMMLNVILAAFNMLPVPPLDGSRIADFFMPRKLRPQWEAFLQTGPVALAAVIILPMLLGINLFYWPLHIANMALVAVIRLFGAVV